MPKPKVAQPYAPLQNVAGLFALTRGETPSSGFEIADEPAPSSPPSTTILNLNRIVVGDRIRKYLDTTKTESLANSIRQHGFRGILWVRRVGEQYHLIAGGRRYAACQLAGIAEVPVEIWDVTDAEAIQLELLENFQREDLSPIEEAEGVLRMLEVTLGLTRLEVVALLGRMSRRSKTGEPDTDQDNVVLVGGQTDDSGLYQQVEEVFSLIGRYSPESFRTHRLPLLSLPSSLVDAINSNQLEYTKARAIAQIKEESTREQLLEQVLEQNLSLSEIKELVSQSREQPVVDIPPERQIYSRAQGLAKRLRSAKFDGRTLKKAQKLLDQLESLLAEPDT